MKTIRQSSALNMYYESVIRLFMIVYSSSQIIISNIFDCRKSTTGLSGHGILGMRVAVAENIWNQQKMIKLKILAKNVVRMSPTSTCFQRKVEFIARKVTLNHNLKNKIEMSFLSKQVESFWQKLLKRITVSSQVEFLEEMFEFPAEKLAYWHFMSFLNTHLCEESFYE